MFDKIDELGVNTIRTLSMDMIQAANSGHPGLPWGQHQWLMSCGQNF